MYSSMLGGAEWWDERGLNYWCWNFLFFVPPRDCGGIQRLSQYSSTVLVLHNSTAPTTASVTIVNLNFMSIVPAASVVEDNYNGTAELLQSFKTYYIFRRLKQFPHITRLASQT